MLEGITSNDLARLSRELRAIDRDFSNAVQRELRQPVQRATSDLKFAAKTLLPAYIGSDAASGIRSSTSYKGYYIKRGRNDRFTQHGYTDRTGKLRHPLYGNRNYWYDTNISGKGWWSNMLARILPRTTDEFTAAILKIIGRLGSNNLSTSTFQVGGRTRTSLDVFGPQLPGS